MRLTRNVARWMMEERLGLSSHCDVSGPLLWKKAFLVKEEETESDARHGDEEGVPGGWLHWNSVG